MRPKTIFFYFLPFVSLVFFEIAYNDSLQQCLTSGRDKIQKLGFLSFSQVWYGSLLFLEIAYNDSLQQCLTSSRCKSHEKKFWDQISVIKLLWGIGWNYV